MKRKTEAPRWVRFTPSDFLLQDTFGLSAEDVGAHMLLWATSLTGDYQGRLPNDDRLLARLARVSPRRWSAIKERLAKLWCVEKGYCVCAHARAECKAAQERITAAQSAGRLSAEKRLQKQRLAEPSCRRRSTPEQLSSNQYGHTETTDGRGTETRSEGTTDRKLAAAVEAPGDCAVPGMRPFVSSNCPADERIASRQTGSSEGLVPLGSLIEARSQADQVRASMHLAMQVITGKDDQAVPDDRIIQRVIKAANGANPDAIHRLLLQVANGQKRREVGSYGYFLTVVGENFQKR